MTKPAERSRRRCFEIAGRLVRKFAAISPTVCRPPRNRLRISRRVGSAIALNTALLRLRLTVTIRLHLMQPISYDLSSGVLATGTRTSCSTLPPFARDADQHADPG